MQSHIKIWAGELEAEPFARGVTLYEGGTHSIEVYGSENEILAALNRIADVFNAEVSRRDPGPCERCESAIHSTNDHDAATLYKVTKEIEEHNRKLGAS